MSTVPSIACASNRQSSLRAAVSRWAYRERSYLVCAIIALAAIWAHRYPVGIDIAQHANLFRISVDMTWGPSEWRSLFRLDPFTPYLLAYLVAYPFALLLGAIAATKCLLTLIALLTPLMMRRWLRTIGADPRLAIFGFLVAFDFQYHWGFISHGLAIPLAFGYLAASEREGARPGLRAVVKTSLWGAALFFCHGITFGLCMLITAARLLLRRHPLEAWRAGLHVLPLALLAGRWALVHRQSTGEQAGNDWVDLDRLVSLFSGPFAAYPHRMWMWISIGALLVLLVVMRPRVAWQARRLYPLAIATLAFLALPETLAATWMIASRFCVFVHAFAPAAILPRDDGWLGRQWPRVAFAWVLFALVSLNVRLVDYNQEIAGLGELPNHIQHGFDVRTMVPATRHDSETMGRAQFGQAAAWITAECGGLIDNDSAGYYQMPIRHGDMRRPSDYRYIVARGSVVDVTPMITNRWPKASLIHQASSWLLFEDPPAGNQDFTVVRSTQSWGHLQRDKSVSETPLSIGGARFDRGLGTHADSFMRVKINRSGRAFAGACGIDDSGGQGGAATFRIRDDQGGVLFESGETRWGEPARRFSVLLGGRQEIILEIRKIETIDRAHADWVDLHITEP